jgi:GNAT superfamily N-acetyltransferase
MDVRIESVDPGQAVPSACEILRAAWSPPCIHYSTAYLQWQLTFPGELVPRLAMAFCDGAAIGCTALTPRRFYCDGASFPGYVMSFGAVHPAMQGSGVATKLYEKVLELIPHDVPTIAFTQPESSSEGILLRALGREFQRSKLRECRAVGFALPPQSTDSVNNFIAEDVSVADFITAFPSGGDSVIWNAPSQEQLQHYITDPRRRSLVVIRDRLGDSIATVMRVDVEMMTSEGLQRVPMLESLCCLGVPSADAIRAAFQWAQKERPGALVVASNLSHIDERLLRPAGVRALPSIFNAHVFTRGTKLPEASSVNLEVI